MDVAFSASQVLIGFAVLVFIILAMIIVLRRMFSSKEGLAEKYADKSWGSPLQARAKYPDVNIFKHSGTIFRFGLAAALDRILTAKPMKAKQALQLKLVWERLTRPF